jgi:hypothetical protein
MPRGGRRASQGSRIRTDNLIRGGSRARLGEAASGSLLNTKGALGLKRRLSKDYQPDRGTRLADEGHLEPAEGQTAKDLAIHKQACRAIEHFEKYGDSRALTNMAQAMKSDSRCRSQGQ